MKKIIAAIFTCVMCVGFVPNTQAQEEKEGFEGKKIYLDLGIGLSRYGFGNNLVNNYYGYNRYSLPTLRANLEYGFNHFISGGLYAGYNHYGYKGADTYFSNGQELGYDYKNQTSHLSIGVRATFHVWAFLNKQLELGLGVNQLDLYVSIMTGVRVQTDTDHYIDYINGENRLVKEKDRSFGPHFGPTVGAKYYFANNVGVFLEAGYGASSFGLFGLGFKF
jgi:hypothetical protein